MKRNFRGEYSADWPAIARRVKAEAGWCCVRCGKQHHPQSGYTLTVDHLTGEKSDNRWWNLLPLCQRCHLSVQGRVIVERPWIFDHTPWFQPYVAGWYGWFYLGEELTRAEVEARLPELLDLERQAVLGERA